MAGFKPASLERSLKTFFDNYPDAYTLIQDDMQYEMTFKHCVARQALWGENGKSRRNLNAKPHVGLLSPAATVREATADDANAIAAFDREYSVCQAREEIERGISRVHVALDDGAGNEVVGWLAAWLVPPYELQIIQITVSPAMRRQGVGSMLLQTAIDTYGPSVSQVVLEVRENNVAACGLYEKVGFARLGAVRKNYYADGAGALCMALNTEAR
jgi:ribosomal protein S18 acetylase RimI-like enzyme